MSPYYRIKRVRVADVINSVTQASENHDGYGKVQGFGIAGGGSKTVIKIKEGNIVLEIQVLPLRTVHLYFEERKTVGEKAGWQMLQRAVDAGSAVIACVQASKHVRHWLILARKAKERENWRTLGFLETGHIRDGINIVA